MDFTAERNGACTDTLDVASTENRVERRRKKNATAWLETLEVF